jgi:hypothetical protein
VAYADPDRIICFFDRYNSIRPCWFTLVPCDEMSSGRVEYSADGQARLGGATLTAVERPAVPPIQVSPVSMFWAVRVVGGHIELTVFLDGGFLGRYDAAVALFDADCR